MIGVAGRDRARRRLRRRRDHDHRRPRRRPLRRQRRQDVHHLRRARRLRHDGGAHRRARARRDLAARGREGHAGLRGRPGRWPRWAGCARTPPSCPSSTPGCRSATWSARRTAGSCRSPSSSWSSGSRSRSTPTASPRGRSRSRRRTAVSGRRSASRWPRARWCGTGWSRCTSGSTSRAPTRGPSPRATSAGENVVAEACLAKNNAVEACSWVVDQAVQLHGGTGYMHGTEVERHYRDARILPIGGGATEVLTDLAARLLGYAG